MYAVPNRSVLIVGNFLSGSIASRGVCEELSLRLASSGWSVLITSRFRGRISRLSDMLWTVWSKRYAYKVAQVDVYSGLAFRWAELVCWMLRLTGKPYVLTLHGGNLPDFFRRNRTRGVRLLDSADAVTAPSAYLLEQMRPYFADIRLLPNAVDLQRYRFLERRCVRPKLVWLRAFHQIYNPTLAVRVLALLKEQHPDVSLLMIGPDKGDGSLQAVTDLADELGVRAHLEIVKGVPKEAVPEWLQKGDILLNTTNIDNMPVGVIEGLACGLCVVSTDVGGIPYLLSHGENALLVAPDDPGAMAGAVSRILNEPGFSSTLSRAARQKAEHFDWSLVLPQWERLLASLHFNSHV
jgi:glycosyltransferase involved in cell wall biosynthesis